MTLRRRLVATMVVVVAMGLIAVDLVALASLRSFLVGRVDSQLTVATHQVAGLVARDQNRHEPVTEGQIQGRISPDVYVELLDPRGVPIVVRPSGTRLEADPAPRLPDKLPVRPLAADYDYEPSTYRPSAAAVTVGSEVEGAGRHVRAGPQYRMMATSLPGSTLVVATRLDSVSATLSSLRAILAGLTLGLLGLLVLVITIIVRRGLRPLEDMSREADAIAAGDLTRRVHPDDGTTEISRLGRALNGMLAQIETAFSLRAGSEERLRSFLADASHELRTPLTSIQGYAELLRKDALPDPAARERALARIEQEAARMGRLVGDLAVLAREGEGPEPERTRVDLAEVVAEVVSDARMIDRTRGISVQRSGEVPVQADHGRLEQMVHNLVGNALAHTPAGTPIEVRVTAEDGRAVLVVQDHGPGMDPEQAERAFDRFYRGTSAGRGQGSGLGLFIVASLARSFGGDVSVDSTPGSGCAFVVALPLDAGSDDRAPDGGPPARAPGAEGREPRHSTAADDQASDAATSRG